MLNLIKTTIMKGNNVKTVQKMRKLSPNNQLF